MVDRDLQLPLTRGEAEIRLRLTRAADLVAGDSHRANLTPPEVADVNYLERVVGGEVVPEIRPEFLPHNLQTLLPGGGV